MKDYFKQANILLIKAGIFLVPVLPLYIANSLFFPFITGKAFVFRIITEIIFAGWVLLAIFYKEYRPKKNPILIAIAAFILIVAAATFLGINPVKSFWSNFERMEGLVTYLHLFAYFIVLSNVFKKSDWFILFNIFVGAGLIENGYSLLQKMGKIASPQGGFRVDGTIGNPTYLAAYLIFVLGISVYLLINTKKRLLKYLYSFASLFTLAIIFFTASRGPTLGILAGIIIAAVLYLFIKKNEDVQIKLYKKIVLSALIFIAVVVGALWVLKDKPFVQNNQVLSRLTSLSFTEKTITARFTIWSMSWQAFKERPILGWGPENYMVVFSKYYRPELWQQEPWFDRSHNIVFDWLINAGALGLLSYLSIFGAAFYTFWKKKNEDVFSVESKILISVLLFVYFFQNLFVFDNIATYIGFFTILAFIYNYGVVNKNKDVVDGKEIIYVGNINNKFSTAALVFLPLILVIYFINVKPIVANQTLLSALQTQRKDPDFNKAFELYGKALSYDTFGNREIREQLAVFSTSVAGLQNYDSNLKTNFLNFTIEESIKSANENELDPRAFVFLGNTYAATGDYANAIIILGKAIELSPKKQQLYFSLGDVYLKTGDIAKAVSVLETAFNFDRHFNYAGLNLSAAYILAGQQKKADEVLIGLYGTVDVGDALLTAAYSRVKNYPRLLEVWKALVINEPLNIQNRKGLISTYFFMGNESEAQKEYNIAVRDVPGFEKSLQQQAQ